MARSMITQRRHPAFQYSPGVAVGDLAFRAGHLVFLAVLAGHLVFLAGHLSFHAEGRLVSEELGPQVRIPSYDDMKEIDQTCRELVPGELPARTSLVVAGPPLGARFEVDGIAVLDR